MNSRFFYNQVGHNNLKIKRGKFIKYWRSCVVVVAFFFNLANLQKIIGASEHVYGNTTGAGSFGFGRVFVAVRAGFFIFFGYKKKTQKKLDS